MPSVTLNLESEVAEQLTEMAAQRGLSLTDYLLDVLAHTARQGRSADPAAAAKAEAFKCWTETLRRTSFLSDEAMSRKNLIRDVD